MRNLYLKRGDKVRYCYPRNGHSYDKEQCRKLLKLGNIYTIEYAEVGDFSSIFGLIEFPDERFNTVMFSNVYNKRGKLK